MKVNVADCTVCVFIKVLKVRKIGVRLSKLTDISSNRYFFQIYVRFSIFCQISHCVMVPHLGIKAQRYYMAGDRKDKNYFL